MEIFSLSGSYFGIWYEAEIQVTFFHLFEYHLVNNPSLPYRFVIYQQEYGLVHVSVQAVPIGAFPISSGAHLLGWINCLRPSGAPHPPSFGIWLYHVLPWNSPLFLSYAVVGFCMVVDCAAIKRMGTSGEAGTKQLGRGEWEPAVLSSSPPHFLWPPRTPVPATVS